MTPDSIVAGADRIVAGASSTREGRVAVDWALRRAERLGLPVATVYVQEHRMRRQRHQPAEQALVPSASAFSADAIAPHVDVTTVTEEGRAVDQLVAESRTARMVVVGRHSREDGTHEVRHSPALELALHAECPVAVVPVPRPGHHAGVVVGVDGSERAAAALSFAAEEAVALDEELTVVNAWSPVNLWVPGMMPDDSFFDRIAAASRELVERELIPVRAAHPGLRVRVVVDQGFPAAVLSREAMHASELVVGSRGLHGIAELMLGSVSHELVVDPPCPLIVLPASITAAVPV